ncbi:TPA: sodium:alanine symporter family protein, partial [Mannheimia haemolytica]|nr:sodium:alanine symporter family protein [Mannheimia haemolytica]
MDSIILFFESVLTWIVNTIDGPLWDVTIILLLGAGLFFTLTTGFVQLRLLPQSLREMWGGRSTEGKSLT